ncbi:MAG: CoB--CoM heterodisulfide reductase iron-sulfur subunit B family protein [Candidatus Thermoplasmatota archaeon]|nr:CoB--CoM heterodisulfide reductase iron-sulfur subunit B family protein [Candidatus Thermoplasmatota archaeon]MBU1941325.1 CoB--CoM heterodisulfide reductase iron-sulfur subunit B family protein [Candidatus Thermoplasmatota archaeon]
MKKKYGLYPGCVMPTEQYAYELSAQAVLSKLNIDLIDIPNQSCCGEPLKSVNKLMTLYLSARNLALAEHHNLDLFVPCPMCHLALSEAKKILKENPDLKEKITAQLQNEGLTYQGTTSIVHTIDLLHDHIGLETIKKHVTHPLKDLKVAVHYGCHLNRPKDIGRPVDSENPQKMEHILKTLGSNPVDYPQKLDCCGALLTINLPESALTKTGQKLDAVQNLGFDVFVDTCPWCHKMFDARQTKAGETVAKKLSVPVVYLTQLVGLAFGFKETDLGLHLNQSPVDALLSR